MANSHCEFGDHPTRSNEVPPQVYADVLSSALLFPHVLHSVVIFICFLSLLGPVEVPSLVPAPLEVNCVVHGFSVLCA